MDKTTKNPREQQLETSLKKLMLDFNANAFKSLRNKNQHYKIEAEDALVDTKEWVTLTSIYGKYLVVTPYITIADQYRIPMTVEHAENFIRKNLGLNIDLTDVCEDSVVVIGVSGAGADLQQSWFKDENIKFLMRRFRFTPIDNVEYKKTFDEDFAKFGLNYKELIDGNYKGTVIKAVRLNK